MSLAAYDGGRRPARHWLLEGLANQAHVIGALILRELHTRFGRDNIGYLWVILEPMSLACAVAAMHAGAKTHFGSDIRPVPFSLCGYCTFIVFRSIILRAETTLQANQPLLYHRMVTIFDMLFARAVLEFASTGMAFAILMAGACALGLADPPARLLVLFAGFGLMLWFSWAVSMLLCAGAHASHLVTRFVHPITYIMMPISGGFLMLKWIPEPYKTWLYWFPMAQIFEMVRHGVFASADDRYYDTPYIIGWCLALTFVGMVSLRLTRRHVHLQ